MKNKMTIIKTLLILLFCSSFFQLFAITSEQKGMILESFRKIEQDIIFEGDNYFDEKDSAIFTSSNKINIFNAITEKVKDKRLFLEGQNQNIIKRIASLEDNIREIDTSIEDITKQVSKTNDDIIYAKEQVDTNQKAINVLSKKIEINRQVMLDYMVHLYKKWNYVYDDKNIDNLKTIILSGDDVSGVMNDLFFKWVIEISWQKLIDQHRGYISQLYVKKVDLQGQEASLKDLRKSLILEKKMLDDKKELKKKLLDVSKWTESIYKKYIAEKVKLEQSIQIKSLEERIKFRNAQKKVLDKNGCKYIDMSENTIFTRLLKGKCLELNRIIYDESKLRDVTPDNGTANVFDWPLYPYYGISAFFNDEDYRKEFGTNHGAIDIITPQGSPIKAPADGYVVFISPPTSSDYAFIALKHANGYVTVYGHISEILVHDLDFIQKGQVFAKSGGEYWTNGAWVLTTWPHVHFEVWKDKVLQDPLEHLDTSYLSYKTIPDKYKYKFSSDFKLRKGFSYEESLREDGKQIFKIEGDTEVERQKSLLTKYAAPAFKDWNIWVEESLDGNIDPTFVMCIWLAETGLGNHLKTAYNVWNVGNTDSGGTWDFPNARSGIMWIVRTLNNAALGKYDEIQQLSRFWNKDGSIYASSEDHWHSNVTKCMSHIKQRYIPDNYNFRIQ